MSVTHRSYPTLRLCTQVTISNRQSVHTT